MKQFKTTTRLIDVCQKLWRFSVAYSVKNIQRFKGLYEYQEHAKIKNGVCKYIIHMTALMRNDVACISIAYFLVNNIEPESSIILLNKVCYQFIMHQFALQRFIWPINLIT